MVAPRRAVRARHPPRPGLTALGGVDLGEADLDGLALYEDGDCVAVDYDDDLTGERLARCRHRVGHREKHKHQREDGAHKAETSRRRRRPEFVDGVREEREKEKRSERKKAA